eukprot:7383262-Pyramimonas_sp.AAC.1
MLHADKRIAIAFANANGKSVTRSEEGKIRWTFPLRPSPAALAGSRRDVASAERQSATGMDEG